MFPRRSLAVRKFDRKRTSSNIATFFNFSSRKRKRPPARLTRSISGLKADAVSASTGRATESGGPGAGAAVTVSSCFSGAGAGAGETGLRVAAEEGRGGTGSGGREGRRHFPSAFWAQV